MDTRKVMGELNIHYVSLDESDNQERHRTQGFSGSKALVVRRGAPFRISLQLKGRPFNPQNDSLVLKAVLDSLYVTMPVTSSVQGPASRWRAHLNPEGLNPQHPSSIFISSPADASVGTYTLELYVVSQTGQRRNVIGNFILLCNPWCREDVVFVPSEDQRDEYVLNDSGLLFMGTSNNHESIPWSFDQYETGVLETCLQLLQVSPQHMKDRQKDLFQRTNPVYLSRVVSAMINCEDDRGILRGNWSGDFKEGVDPARWTGSRDILRQWAKSGFSPVNYGQCWVFAAVMCTVMRALGIPCRVVTNFNSAHDTNANLVIEEYYSETGKKLPHTKDSIWNFHVWVECWMTRPDLGSGLDGWQVLDPTPQERSRGVFCCGPAPVKAIRDKCLDMVYDVPFVYAEVNADVRTFIVRQGQVLDCSTDTERVGSLILTKAIGSPRPQNIIADYKKGTSPKPSLRSRRAAISEESTLRRNSSKAVSVSMSLDETPVAGRAISFTVTVSNNTMVAKVMREHVNAQAKEYNHSPSDTFWESHNIVRLAPMEVKVLCHQISPVHYEDMVGDNLVNLAVVLEDEASQDRSLASEEFNIASPELTIQIADEDSIVPQKEHTALMSFTNAFSVPVSGVLTVAGAGLIQRELHFRMATLPPGGRVEQNVTFIPRMGGTKMLQACLTLNSNKKTVIRGFRMVSVKTA